MKKSKISVRISIEKELVEEWNRIAKLRKTTKSAMIDYFLRNYLKHLDQKLLMDTYFGVCETLAEEVGRLHRKAGLLPDESLQYREGQSCITRLLAAAKGLPLARPRKPVGGKL